jgi:hypothetical protein
MRIVKVNYWFLFVLKEFLKEISHISKSMKRIIYNECRNIVKFKIPLFVFDIHFINIHF